MADLIITRSQAREQGLNRYFTGKPCVNAHVEQRRVSDAKCISCSLDNGRRRYEREAETCRASARASCAKRYRDNPDAERRRKKAWRDANRERVRLKQAEANRRYAQAHPTLAAERFRARFDKDPEQVREVQRQWRAANPDKVRATWVNRRAREKGADGQHSAADLEAIFKAQGGKCAVCKAKVGIDKEVDHIIPLVSGGSNWPANLQYLCRPCNRSKGAKDPNEFARRRGLLL